LLSFFLSLKKIFFLKVDDNTLIQYLQNAPWEQLIQDPEMKSWCVQIKKKFEDTPSSEAARMKLVVVGDGAVGKTSLLISYATDKFPEDYVPTVFENYTAQMNHNGQQILLHLWDTAGQEEYDRLRPLSYPGSDIVLLCFSLVHKHSYEAIKEKWAPEIHHYIANVPLMLVGTKLDLRTQLIANPNPEYDLVSTEMGESLCKEIGALKYIEVSSKTRENLETVFTYSVNAILQMTIVANSKNSATPVSTSPEIDNHMRKVKRTGGGGCLIL